MRRLSLVTVRGISASLRSLGNFFFPLLLAVVEGDVELVLDLVGVSDAAVSDLLVGGPAGCLPRPLPHLPGLVSHQHCQLLLAPPLLQVQHAGRLLLPALPAQLDLLRALLVQHGREVQPPGGVHAKLRRFSSHNLSGLLSPSSSLCPACPPSSRCCMSVMPTRLITLSCRSSCSYSSTPQSIIVSATRTQTITIRYCARPGFCVY